MHLDIYLTSCTSRSLRRTLVAGGSFRSMIKKAGLQSHSLINIRKPAMPLGLTFWPRFLVRWVNWSLMITQAIIPTLRIVGPNLCQTYLHPTLISPLVPSWENGSPMQLKAAPIFQGPYLLLHPHPRLKRSQLYRQGENPSTRAWNWRTNPRQTFLNLSHPNHQPQGSSSHWWLQKQLLSNQTNPQR